MSEVKIFIEGGGNRTELKTRCREGFCKLLHNSGFSNCMPRLVACGSRNAAFDDFQTASKHEKTAFVALLVDSEDPVIDGESPWEHLAKRDNWKRPSNVTDDQVFLMSTCMETWLVADRAALKKHYINCLQESALPPLVALQSRDRHVVQDSLVNATRNCTNAYEKNKRSFALLSVINPYSIEIHLPAFARMVRILKEKL